MLFDPANAARIEAAIDAAQARTSGQIVCVVARASSDYETMPILLGTLVALAAPWPLLLFTQLSAQRIFVGQLLVFILVLAALLLSPLRLILTPASWRRANAHRAALGQFMIRGVSRSAKRNGVLLYVSMAERYARIIADDGAAAAIGQDKWQRVIDKLLADMRRGDATQALIGAATGCGDLLAPHFPPPASENWLAHQQFHVI